MAGDCEDYALLLSSMVARAGGTARVYLTIDHAFAAVYVGNTSMDLADATDDVRAYYGTDVNVHAFSDELGYWMVADPLGSFYMGGLAVNQTPMNEHLGTWNTTFPTSDDIHSIDVTGIRISQPLWLDQMLWMGMILIFGFATIAVLLMPQPGAPQPKTLCHICAAEVAPGDLYLCPHCKTTYHRPCAFSRAQCMTCGKATQYPPPPPPGTF
jgi:hypothetical protein